MINKKTFICILISAFQMGCSLDAFVKAKDPEAEREMDRSYMKSFQGAIALFNSSLGNLQDAVSRTAIDVSLLTDELAIRPQGNPDFSTAVATLSDVRQEQIQMSRNDDRINGLLFPAYNEVHAARIAATQSRSLLRQFGTASSEYLVSATYAIEGYTILIMAENMCSGIPLSDVPFEGVATYGKGFRTDELFNIAISKFDSALNIEHDSLRYTVLATIGKGRALMGLGEYARAAETVKDIQPIDKFELRYSETHTPNFPSNPQIPRDAFWTWVPASAAAASKVKGVEIVNNEGINGLVWYSDANALDPRLPVTTSGAPGGKSFPAVVRQEKFVKGAVRLQIAKWAEAKMIEAEYRLNSGDANWIDPLNEARRSIGLSDTVPPASQEGKVDLLFRERAYWFYGEAVRLADFRRLVTQYNRHPLTVYPTGGYTRLTSYPHYGNAFVYVPHVNEHNYNHLYSGCLNENP